LKGKATLLCGDEGAPPDRLRDATRVDAELVGENPPREAESTPTSRQMQLIGISREMAKSMFIFLDGS
jgi:hypothetical protein